MLPSDPAASPSDASLLPASDVESLRAAVAGRYAVERPLGAGGMGSVWLGRDEALDRPVAIKVIAPELTASAVLRGRFLQEARTVARLRHPHIVQVYAAGEAGPLLWFAMEFVAGGSLRDRLDAGALPPAEAAAVLRDLADALAEAHGAGVVHRDLKPENVLVEQGSGRVRLTDFGVARAFQSAPGDGGDGRLTRTGLVIGSPRYMSPEQAAGDRDLDGRSDLYALGLIGYELLAGAPAFDGGTPATLLVRQLTQPPPALAPLAPGAPAALVAVIDRALEKDPADRWPDAAAMRDALDAVLADPALAGALPAPGRGARPAGVGRTPAGTPAAGTTTGTAAGATPTTLPAPVTATRVAGRRRWLAGAALAAVLAGAVAYAGLAHRADGPPAGVDPRRSFAVAPFDVLSPDPQLNWLREGSVNMLTLDLAQWRDVQVADYERTLDVLRTLKLDAARRLSLDEARELARKAGAWTVVTGRVQGTGDSLLVVATLYDVASGRKLDEAQRGAARTADPRPLFDEVARDLLGLEGAPAMDAALTSTMTGSLAAYRSYLDGVRALNSWRLAEADTLLGRAVAADTAFALAWYKRALGRGWGSPGDSLQAAFMSRALAHADRLAPRQRALVEAYAPLSRAFIAGQRGGPAAEAALFDSARVRFAAAAAADSLSADAWYGLGDAWYHRTMAEAQLARAATAPLGSDSARATAVLRPYGLRFAHGFTESRRAFERTIALDSSYHLAYSHLVSIYGQLAGPDAQLAFDGDSLRFVYGANDVRAYGGPARVEQSRARGRQLVEAAARGWAQADPEAPQAQQALMSAFLATGRPDSAVVVALRTFDRPGRGDPATAYVAVSTQFDADPAGVPRVLARVLARFPADSVRPAGDGAQTNTLGAATLAAAAAAGVGRLADARALLAAAEAASPTLRVPGVAAPVATHGMLQWYGTALEVAAGLPAGPRAARLAAGVRVIDGLAEQMRRSMPAEQVRAQVTAQFAPVAYAAALATGDRQLADAAARWAGPATTGTSAQYPELDAHVAFVRGDTAAAAALARAFPDPGVAAPAGRRLGLSGLRAAARVEVLSRAGDVRRALVWSEMIEPPRFSGVGAFETGLAAYAPTLLTRAALYERAGDPARAAVAYQRFLAVRAAADPAFAEQTAAARAGLARVRDRATTAVPAAR